MLNPLIETGYYSTHQKFIQFINNPIIENALFHTYIADTFEHRWIFATKEDFEEIYHLIHPYYKQYVVKALIEMNHDGIDYAFWIEDNLICFEG